MYTVPMGFTPPGLVGEPQPADHFQLESVFSDAQEFFEMHTCIVQTCSDGVFVYYPIGTTRQMYCPVVYSERWQVILPDGTELEECHGRSLATNQILYSFPDARPEEKKPVNHSAVARLREDIDTEIRSMQMAQQFSAVSRHDAITARSNNLGLLTDQLGIYVGRQIADQITCERYIEIMG